MLLRGEELSFSLVLPECGFCLDTEIVVHIELLKTYRWTSYGVNGRGDARRLASCAIVLDRDSLVVE
jgi:hypothetical protein